MTNSRTSTLNVSVSLLAVAFAVAVMPALLVGCPQQSAVELSGGNAGILPKNDGVLCKQAICDLTAGATEGPSTGTVRGQVMVSNSNDQLFVSFLPGEGFQVSATHVDVLCMAPDGRGSPGAYNSVINLGPVFSGDMVTHVFDFSSLSGSDGCTLDLNCTSGLSMQTVYIRAHAISSMAAGNGTARSFGGMTSCDDGALGVGFSNGASSDGNWFGYIEYTVSCCAPDEPVGDTCRTQGQGGWGAPPHGMNPGMIREAVFDACYPNGLVLGCNGGTGNSILLTSSQAVEDFLPTGGQSHTLHQDYIDPTGKTTAGAFAGHLAAIKLSMCAAQTLPDFSPCSGNALNSLCYINEGSPFDGLIVDEIVLIADEIIGGCRDDYDIQDLRDALADISENYNDGGLDLGMLFECQ